MLFPHIRPPVIAKVAKSEFFCQFGRQPGVVYKFREISVQFDTFRLQVALQMCHSYVGEETCTSEQV